MVDMVAIKAEDVEVHQLYEKKYLKIVIDEFTQNGKIKQELAKAIINDDCFLNDANQICAIHKHNMVSLVGTIALLVILFVVGWFIVGKGNIAGFMYISTSFIIIFVAVMRNVANHIQTRALRINELYKKLKAASLINSSQSTNKTADRLNTTLYQNSWAKVEAMIATDNDLVYNTVILEAAKLVDKALQELGAEGDSFGERLKSFSDRFSDFGKAWATLRVRNQIAHETDFAATKREATDAILTFKNALQDLGALA